MEKNILKRCVCVCVCVCVCITESLCSTAEINVTLQISSASIKKIVKLKKKVNFKTFLLIKHGTI